MARIELENQDIKVSQSKEKNCDVYHDSQLVYLWELTHEPDLKQVENWRSWQSK